MTYKLNTAKPNLLILILLISFPSVATVLISPALPTMATFFQVSSGYVQQLITVAVIGYAVGQLVYSPLANRFGRKIAVYIGISIYLISALTCLFSIYFQDINAMLIGRFLMLLGSSVGMTISFTIINDFYYPEQARPIVSYTVLSYAFMPALAIYLGGLITSHLSWVDCFYFYLAYGVFILLIVTQLPETLQTKNLHALNLRHLVGNYYHGFKTHRLVLFSSIYGLMSAFIYLIASGAPFIGIKTIGLSPAYYGTLLLFGYCGQFIGALSAGKFSKHLSVYPVMALGYGATILGSLIMFVCFIMHVINTVTLIGPLFLIMMGLPMTYSSVTVMALADYPDKATGSSIMSFMTMSIALIASFSLTVLPNHPITLPSLFVLICILALFAFWRAKRRYPNT